MNASICLLMCVCVCKSVCVVAVGHNMFTAVCKRGVCKHQLFFHGQDSQQTVFCHLLFVPRKQLSEREHKKYCNILYAHDLPQQLKWTTTMMFHLIRVYMGVPDSLQFWAKLLGDKGNAAGQWTNDVQGSAHWQTRLLYPNPVDGCTGRIS